MQINNNFGTTTPSYRNNFKTLVLDSQQEFNSFVKTEENEEIVEKLEYVLDSDNKLTEILGVKTSNKINWSSTGVEELTDEQIEELKGKFNFDNLSDVDFFNLLSDLTNLNVISQDDINGLFFATASPTGILVPTNGTLNYQSSETSSLFERMQISYEKLKTEINYYSSDDFWKNNLNVDYKDFLSFNQKETERLEIYDKFFSVVNSLK